MLAAAYAFRGYESLVSFLLRRLSFPLSSIRVPAREGGHIEMLFSAELSQHRQQLLARNRHKPLLLLEAISRNDLATVARCLSELSHVSRLDSFALPLAVLQKNLRVTEVLLYSLLHPSEKHSLTAESSSTSSQLSSSPSIPAKSASGGASSHKFSPPASPTTFASSSSSLIERRPSSASTPLLASYSTRASRSSVQFHISRKRGKRSD